jgi:type VI secretion system protein VasG
VLEAHIRPLLSQHFKPALLARMRVVPYYPVSGAVLRELVELKLVPRRAPVARVSCAFSHCQRLVDHLVERCTQVTAARD